MGKGRKSMVSFGAPSISVVTTDRCADAGTDSHERDFDERMMQVSASLVVLLVRSLNRKKYQLKE